MRDNIHHQCIVSRGELVSGRCVGGIIFPNGVGLEEKDKCFRRRLKVTQGKPAIVGIAFFDADGRYIITVMRSDRARYASNALWQGTPDENKETADGTITYFGTYSITEADSSIAIHVEGSSFPNWNGTDQKRFVAIAGDQLPLTVRPPAGDPVDVIWKRSN